MVFRALKRRLGEDASPEGLNRPSGRAKWPSRSF